MSDSRTVTALAPPDADAAFTRHRAQLAALGEVAAAMAAGGDRGALLQLIVDHACSLLGAESASLDLIEDPDRAAGCDPATVWRTTVATAGPVRRPVGSRRPLDDGGAGWAIRRRSGVLARSVSRGQVQPAAAAASVSPFARNESAAVAPLLIRDQVLGVLSVFDARVDAFDADDLCLLEQFAAHAALVIDAGHRLDTEQVGARALRELSAAVEQIVEGVAVVDPDGTIAFANAALATLTGYPPAELRGRSVGDLLSMPDASAIDAALAVSLELRRELALVAKDGTGIPVDVHVQRLSDLGFPQWVVSIRDLRHRRDLELRLSAQASRDGLTGLANRTALQRHLGQVVATAIPGGPPTTMLLVNIDRFKSINDSLGHAAGDELLVAVADRLRSVIRTEGFIARLGGDEFVITAVGLSHRNDGARVARRLAHCLTAPIPICGRDLVVTASIGIVEVGPDDDPDTLLSSADAAMVRVKDRGRNGYAWFHPGDSERRLADVALELDLQEAVADGQLRLHYQPIINLDSGSLSGWEALVRWQHPVHGLLEPGAFLPIAEASGQMTAIGQWVIVQGIHDLGRRLADDPSLALNVNFSPGQLQDLAMVRLVETALAEATFQPRQLILEMTEELILRASNLSTLRRLRDLGVRLAIDDFGTGYSSLAYLRDLPAQVLKLDRAFVAGVGLDHADSAIARTVIELAHTLGLAVIAEGIETTTQRDALRQMRCPYGQGFLLGHPEPLPAVAAVDAVS